MSRVVYNIFEANALGYINNKQNNKLRNYESGTKSPLYFDKDKNICNSVELHYFLFLFISSNLLSTPKPKTSGLYITNHGYGSGGTEVINVTEEAFERSSSYYSEHSLREGMAGS